MAQSTNAADKNIRAAYPATLSAGLPAGSETDTNMPAESWETGCDSMAIDTYDELESCKRPATESEESNFSSTSDTNSTQAAAPRSTTKTASIGAIKMDAARAVHVQNGTQNLTVSTKLSSTFGMSLCLTVGGAGMQIACLAFLINDFVNNPKALSENSGRQALYGLGLTAGVFSLITGGCCLILDVNK